MKTLSMRVNPMYSSLFLSLTLIMSGFSHTAYAQTAADTNTCLSANQSYYVSNGFKPSSTPVYLPTSGQTISIPTQSTPSILEYFIYSLSGSSNSNNCFEPDFPYPNVATLPGPSNTSATVLNIPGNIWSDTNYPWSQYVGDSASVIPGQTLALKMSFYPTSNDAGQISHYNTYVKPYEDALINQIDATKSLSFTATDNGSPMTATVPMTNCVTLSGTGPITIAFRRSDDWNSSISDFLSVANDITNQIKSTDPFKHYLANITFEADLKKVSSAQLSNDNNNLILSGGSLFYNGTSNSLIRSTSSCKATVYITLMKHAGFYQPAWSAAVYGVVYVNLAESDFSNPLSNQFLDVVATHELGHALALLEDEYVNPSLVGGNSITDDAGNVYPEENCSADPWTDYSYSNNMYGSVNSLGCDNAFSPDAQKIYYRPSGDSIMNAGTTTRPIPASKMKFNIISCGYIEAALLGQPLSKANASTHWAECETFDTIGKSELPTVGPAPVVVTVGGVMTNQDSAIFSWMNQDLPASVQQVQIAVPGFTSGAVEQSMRQAINTALAGHHPVLVVGHSFGSLMAYAVSSQYTGQDVQFIYVDPPYNSPLTKLGGFSPIATAIQNATDLKWTLGNAFSNYYYHNAFGYPTKSGTAPNGQTNAANLAQLQTEIANDLATASDNTTNAYFSGTTNPGLTSSPSVSGLSPALATPGTNVSVNGSFDPSGDSVHIQNTSDPSVYYDFYDIVPQNSNTTLMFTLPEAYDWSGATSDTIPGTYMVEVAGSNSGWTNAGILTVTESSTITPPVPTTIVPDTTISGQFIVSGSNFSSTGNSIGLTPTSLVSTASLGTSNTASVWNAFINFIKNLFSFKKTSAQTVTAPSYIIPGLTSGGSSVTFQVPSTVPAGSYVVSIRSAGSNWVQTPITIAKAVVCSSGSNLQIDGTCSTSTTSSTGPSTTVPATPVYVCPSGYTPQTDGTCYKPSMVIPTYTIPVTYYCPDGSTVHSTPSGTVGASSPYSCIGTYGYYNASMSCPTGDTGPMYPNNSWICNVPAATSTPSSVAGSVSSYTCSIGSLSGSSCIVPGSSVVTPASVVAGLATYAITSIPLPTLSLSLSLSPTSVVSGQASTISWTSTNATACTIMENGSTIQSGTSNAGVSSGPLTATTTFSGYCSGGGNQSSTQTVVVTIQNLIGTPGSSGAAFTISATPVYSCSQGTLNASNDTCTYTTTGTINYGAASFTKACPSGYTPLTWADACTKISGSGYAAYNLTYSCPSGGTPDASTGWVYETVKGSGMNISYYNYDCTTTTTTPVTVAATISSYFCPTGYTQDSGTVTTCDLNQGPNGLAGTLYTAHLSWNNNSVLNVKNVEIDRGISYVPSSMSTLAILDPSSTSYTDISPIPGYSYYSVRLIYTNGNYSQSSNPVAMLTSPTLTTSNSGQDTISLRWNYYNDNYLSGMSVERAASANGPYSQIALVSSTTNSYTDTGLTSSTTYYYAVRPKDQWLGQVAYGGYSATSTVTTFAATQKPLLTISNVSIWNMTFNWTSPDPTVTTYSLIETTPASTTLATVPGSVTQYELSLQPATRYCAVVVANAPHSATSTEVCATTLPGGGGGGSFIIPYIPPSDTPTVLTPGGGGQTPTDQGGTDLPFNYEPSLVGNVWGVIIGWMGW